MLTFKWNPRLSMTTRGDWGIKEPDDENLTFVLAVEHWSLVEMVWWEAGSCSKNNLANELFGAPTASVKFNSGRKKIRIRKCYNPLLFSLRFFTQLAILKLVHFRFPRLKEPLQNVKQTAVFDKWFINGHRFICLVLCQQLHNRSEGNTTQKIL